MSLGESRRSSRPSSAPSCAASPAAPTTDRFSRNDPSARATSPVRCRRPPAKRRAWPPMGVRQEPSRAREQRAFRRGHRSRLAVLDGAEQFAQFLVVGSHRDADDALARRRHHGFRVEHRRRRVLEPEAAQPGDRQEARRHLSARHLAPAGFARCRGSWPRKGRDARRAAAPAAGPRRCRPARRPGSAPQGSAGSAGRPPGGSINASRASSRFSVQARTIPAGSCVSRSFRLWTAKSTRRSSSASWISLAKRPLPPISARRRSCTRSPVVRIGCSSKAPAARSTGQKRVMMDRKCRVCQRASGEARVPTRSGSGRRPSCAGTAAAARRSGFAGSGVSGRADRSAGRSGAADMRGT